MKEAPLKGFLVNIGQFHDIKIMFLDTMNLLHFFYQFQSSFNVLFVL